MTKTLFYFIFILSISSCFSQKNITRTNNTVLTFKIKGLQKDSTVYLGNYIGKQLYYFDTAYVQKNGLVEFKDKKVPPGVYALIATMKPVNYFEFIVNEDKIELEGDLAQLRESIKVKKSVENKIFFEYIAFLSKQSKAKQPLIEQSQSETITEKKKKEINEQIKVIDLAVIEYQKELVKKHKDKYVGRLVKMSMEPNNSEIIVPEGVKDSAMYKYMYYRNHYFDNINLKDDAMARTPIFHERLNNYFMKVIPQDPDTITKEVFKLTDKMNEGGDLFKYTVNHLTYAHVKTKRMGMDKVYFRMAEKYFISGRAPWASEKAIDKMKKDVNKLKNILVGNFAPNIILLDTTEKNYVSMYKDIKAKYTLLYFWDWTCGHCKKETPKLKKYVDSLKANTNYDIEVYAVCTKEDNAGWKPFIKEHDLNFINVSDVPNMENMPEYGMEVRDIDGKKTLVRNDNGVTINYRTTYDVFVTPQLFLLDKNKKIIAKQLAIEQVGGLIEHLEKQKN